MAPRIIKSPFPPVPPLPPLNFHTFLFQFPPGNGIPKDHTIHVDGLTGETRSVGQFLERVKDGATALTASISQGGLGIAPGSDEIVGILSPNSLDYIVLVHSCLYSTIPFALLQSHTTQAGLNYLLGKINATRIFVHPSLLSQALQGAKDIGLPADRIYVLGGQVHGRKDFDALIKNVRSKDLQRQEVVPAKKDTLAYLLFSSGTSGPPKGVMISHGNLIFSIVQNLLNMQEAVKVMPPMQPTSPPMWLCFLPFYHSFGLHYFMFRTFVVPITLVILPRWNLDQVLEAIPQYKITHLALVPSLIHQLVNSPKTEKADLSSLQFAGSGAAYLPPELSKKMSKFLKGSPEIPEGYGLSEATISSLARPLPGMLGLQPAPRSTGILLAGQEARIVREDGTDADVNEPGEFWIKGPNVVLGYWKDEAATKATFLPDGWLKTGDRFRVDENGTFFFEDRMKDTLKISGVQVAPAEIETTILSQPDNIVTDVAVAGVPGGRTHDEKVPRAWLVLSDSGKALGEKEVARRVNAWVEERLSKYKWLKGGVGFVDEVPKSPTGKVLRRVLQDAYAKELKEKAKL
ncbi:acetyl-CoA synthetase-like protein [Rickenella mellea]|uniref:Acetyl-CoA synthetase-like protein n=1 Tax=Rickenella mellea TaxID=50990 RepID=A0A4Y7PNE5_9AGAM|nr:acetyl-CoA synthetase-like protein [Rickenella mellea]